MASTPQMTAALATLYGIGMLVGGAFILCLALALFFGAKDWLTKLRKKHRKHRPDCACDPCWAKHCAWMDRVRDVFIRDQVEAMAQDQQGRRP